MDPGITPDMGGEAQGTAGWHRAGTSAGKDGAPSPSFRTTPIPKIPPRAKSLFGGPDFTEPSSCDRAAIGVSASLPDQSSQTERPKKENILDLTKYMDKQVNVKFNGGREIVGTLKGYDQLMNLVLDDVKETMRDDEGNERTRSLGLIVARGTLLVLIAPVDGSEEIENPFAQVATD
ncbi:hypothetical protein DV736_g4432, partial [Chaetothyriales sp. CBS 134916]